MGKLLSLLFLWAFAAYSVESLSRSSLYPKPELPAQTQTPPQKINFEFLNSAETTALKRGPIEKPRYITGALVGTLAGFGLGHAIQKRYMNKGLAFTLGESAGLSLFMVGSNSCFGTVFETRFSGQNESCGNQFKLITIGASMFFAFKVWETLDLWITPPKLNAEYRKAVAKDNRTFHSFLFIPGPKLQRVELNYTVYF